MKDDNYPFGPCVYCGCSVYDEDHDLLPDIQHADDCGVELKEGDFIARRWVESDVAETVCLGCGVLNPSPFQEESA